MHGRQLDLDFRDRAAAGLTTGRDGDRRLMLELDAVRRRVLR